MSAPLVQIRGLTLSAGTRTLVEDLSLQVGVGERWAVIGPNGAGKSTLLGALAGARHVPGGSILLGERPVARCTVEQLAALRALVIDHWVDPFPATVLDTVLTARYRFGAENGARDIALAALADTGCAHLAARDVRSLSRGERQRVALATALAQDTPLLLLDEPTSHQDPGHQAWVLAKLAARARQAVIAALHDVNAAASFATHALLLSGAGWWRAGPRDDVLTAATLSALFDARIEATPAGHGAVFWVRHD